jgi:O-antigen ligase
MSVNTQNLPTHRRLRPLSSYRIVRGYSSLHEGWSFIPLLLWIGMWANLNTGLGNIMHVDTGTWNTFMDDARSFNTWQLFFRALVPYVALPACLVLLGLAREKLPVMKSSPTVFLLIYGCVAALCTFWSLDMKWAFYWSVAYLSAVLSTWVMVKQRRPVLSARLTLEATWVICFIALLILAYLGRGSIFGSQGSEMAYGVSKDLDDASRSSGVGRWAAVPGAVFLLRAFLSKGLRLRIAYIGASLFCLFVVYRVQSRGAFFGVLGALLFAFLYDKRFQSKMAVVLFGLLIAAAAYFSVTSTGGFGEYSQKFSGYIHRGQSDAELESMTGRTETYQRGIAVFMKSPILGAGHWADRLNPEIGQHIHNTLLEALLSAGLVGFIPYMCSWIFGWRLFYQLRNKLHLLSPIDQRRLMEAGVVMAFFTLRAIPETTTASFSVDLMVMVAVYCYMEALGFQVLEPTAARHRIFSTSRTATGAV